MVQVHSVATLAHAHELHVAAASNVDTRTHLVVVTIRDMHHILAHIATVTIVVITTAAVIVAEVIAIFD